MLKWVVYLIDSLTLLDHSITEPRSKKKKKNGGLPNPDYFKAIINNNTS